MGGKGRDFGLGSPTNRESRSTSEAWSSECVLVAEEIARWATILFPQAEDIHTRLPALVERVIQSGSLAYGMAEALDWAQGFDFPEGIGTADAELLQECGMNLAAAASAKQQQIPHSRLSVDRVRRCVPESDPDFANILRLCEGVPFPVSQSFRPNQRPFGLRRRYVLMASVVNKLIFDLYSRHLCLILPTDLVLRILPTIMEDGSVVKWLHFSALHWTTKRGKKCGRPLGDASALESGHPLNEEAVKVMVDDLYGVIVHPTVEKLVAMIMQKTESVGRDNTVLFKLDLRSAFALLNILPSDAGLSAFELTGGLTLVHVAGWFGWCGMPGSFQVITRVLVRLINSHPQFTGLVEMFVDDVMGICAREDVQACIDLISSIVTDLLGSDSVETKKTEWGRALDWIGWRVNLDTFTISVAEHNMLKTLYGFFAVKVESPVSLAELQSLASWASRYCMVCPYMRPHTSPLFHAMGPYGGKPYVRRLLPAHVRVCVLLWRCCLSVLDLYEHSFARPLTSFRSISCTYALEFDASLTGVGILLNRLSPDGQELRWKCVQFHLPFGPLSSGYQNTVEFIAVVFGLLALASVGVRDVAVRLRGDSMSALTWALRRSYKSPLARGAATVYTMLGLHYNISVRESIHIPGVSNVDCDSLSRFYTTPGALGFTPEDVLFPDGCPIVVAFLEFVDPCAEFFDTTESACAYLARVMMAVQELKKC